MKIKTFIILLIFSIVIPIIMFKVKYNNDPKVERYSSYTIKVMESPNDINIVHNQNEDMNLNINFKNNNNKINNLKLMVFIDNKQVDFNYNNKESTSLEFKTDKEEKNFIIKISSKYFNSNKNKITITTLKQEKENKYNDAASKTYLVTTKGIEDNVLNYETEAIKCEMKKLDYSFMGMILNDDIAFISDYNGKNYNNKVFEIKIKNNELKLALRIPNLIKDKKYLLYFTLGDKQLDVEKNKKYIILAPKETASYYIPIQLENIDICNYDYLYCHMVNDITNEYGYTNNSISNKIYLYK